MFEGVIVSVDGEYPDSTIAIDTFESYIDTATLLTVWQDGSTNGSGSVITEVMNGAMMQDYNNTTQASVSTISRQLSPPQDWQVSEMAGFSFGIKGDPANTPLPLTVIVSDGTPTTIQIPYPDTSVLTSAIWQECLIPYIKFVQAGIDLSNITEIKFQIGPGIGAGAIYIDDIILTAQQCNAAFRPTTDMNGDCQTGTDDLLILAQDWLEKDYTVTAVEPNQVGLIAYYNLDETAGTFVSDTSGNGNHGTLTADDPNAIWDPNGYQNGCVRMDDSVVITLPSSVFAGISQEVTISVRLKGDAVDYPGHTNQVLFKGGFEPQDSNSWDVLGWDLPDPNYYDSSWHHWAAVKDAAQGLMRIYHNGSLVNRVILEDATVNLDGSSAGESLITSDLFRLSGEQSSYLDDVQIYNYALSHEEVLYLASGFGSQIIQTVEPLFTSVNFHKDDTINLQDFIQLAQKWLE